MKKFKSLLLAVIGLLCSVSVSAEDFEVEGIYYNITSSTDMTVEVTCRGNYSYSYENEYSATVTIPELVTYNGNTYSVTSIGDAAFSDCSGLTSVVIGNSVTSIGWYAFAYCSGLTSVEIPNSVTSIGWSAFEYCSSLTSVEIPNSVTSIGNYAFRGCSGLTSVVIPNSVTSIGSSAFSGCSGLTSVEIPNSVTSIRQLAFSGCSGLTSVVIPNSVTSIGECAFELCSGLTSVVIGNSVTSIGDHAFLYCDSLTSIAVAEGNPTYDSRDNCNAIIETQTNTLIVGCSETIIPNSVTSIGDYAFYFCYSLTSVEIPNSVTSIGVCAFSFCDRLTSIAVAEGNPTYDSRDNCNAIIETQTNTLIVGCSETTISNSVTSIGDYAFSGCSGLTSVEIPNSVTSIGEGAFYRCSSLTSAEIPNSVTSIGDDAFSGCSGLTSVVIGNSVTSIGEGAFYRCSSVTKLSCYAKVPPTCGLFVFYGIDQETCVLQVPESCLAAYQQADQWKDFFIIEDVLSGIGEVTMDGAVPATADVYSTNGMLIKRNADVKNLKHELPAGIYIIGGKKVLVK